MKTITMEEFLRNPPPFGGRLRSDGKVDMFETQAERDAVIPPTPPSAAEGKDPVDEKLKVVVQEMAKAINLNTTAVNTILSKAGIT